MKTGVLLMAYGSPGQPDEIAPYLNDVRGGRPYSEAALQKLTERYLAVGMPSPLLPITERQAASVQRALGEDFSVMIGMKHWAPRIRAAVEHAHATGVDQLIGVALAPHYSSISIGGYEARVRGAMAEIAATFRFDMIPFWYDEPALIALHARNLRAQMGNEPAHVIFTAHSLPERIIAEGDPYRDQLLASAKLIAEEADAPDWELAFQSASASGEPWLGPDISDAIRVAADHGVARVVVVPVGFVADHLEILFDIDVEATAVAEAVSVDLMRVASPNDDPLLADAIANAVRRVMQA